jgi:hypothetical protein
VSDEGLRDLERLWKATGSLEDEAAFLRERVRAGRLEPAALELAARLGYAAARAALGTGASESASLEDVLRGFAACDKEGGLLVRALAVVARRALEGMRRHVPESDPDELLEAIEAWCERPDRKHVQRIEAIRPRVFACAQRCAQRMVQDHPLGTFTVAEIQAVVDVLRVVSDVGTTPFVSTSRERPARAAVDAWLRHFAVAIEGAGVPVAELVALLRERLAPRILGGR